MSEEISDLDVDEIAKATREAEEERLNLTKSLKNYIDPYKLQKDLSFSEHNLDDAMARQASLYSYYATLATRAHLQMDRAKHSLEIIEAKLYHRLRDEYIGEKVTESFLMKLVTVDKKYIGAMKKYHDAKMIAALCKEATESMRQRRDMLTQSSKWLLEQTKGELFIKGRDGSMEDKKQSVLEKMKR